jgi:hypothetical protein
MVNTSELLEQIGQPLENLPWAGSGRAIELLRRELEGGADWYPAVLRAIARWERPAETYDGRRFVYLIAGEAFDWLLLVERFYAEIPDLLPEDEIEQLVFFAKPPAEYGTDYFLEAIGPAKYRTVLNYYYGITVEEALYRTIEEEITKERIVGAYTSDSRIFEDAAQRIYGMKHAELLERYREDAGIEISDLVSLGDWKQLTYWLFKYRVRQSHRVKVAADTKRGLDTLARLRAEALSGFAFEERPAKPPTDLAPWDFRIIE